MQCISNRSPKTVHRFSKLLGRPISDLTRKVLEVSPSEISSCQYHNTLSRATVRAERASYERLRFLLSSYKDQE